MKTTVKIFCLFKGVVSAKKFKILRSSDESHFGCTFTLVCHPNTDGYVGLFLEHYGSPKELKYTLIIKGQSGNVKSKSYCNLFDNDKHGSSQFLERSVLADYSLPDGSIDVQCTFENATRNSMSNLICFKDSIRGLFHRHEFTDFCIIVHGVRLPVHKVVLAVYSKVFKTMFASPMSESVANEVIINDFSVQAVKSFLGLMYSEPKALTEHHPAVVQEVLLLADKYDADYVMESVIELIRAELLTLESCIGYLQLADRLQCDRLKTTVLTFITPRINDVMALHKESMVESLGSKLSMILFQHMLHKA